MFGPHAEEAAGSFSLGGRGEALGVIAIDSGQNWGAASTELVQALMEEHALAVVALDRDSAHLAEQLALKTFVPVVALCDDKALTSTNVPWIFRLPADAGAAEAMRLVDGGGAGERG